MGVPNASNGCIYLHGSIIRMSASSAGRSLVMFATSKEDLTGHGPEQGLCLVRVKLGARHVRVVNHCG